MVRHKAGEQAKAEQNGVAEIVEPDVPEVERESWYTIRPWLESWGRTGTFFDHPDGWAIWRTPSSRARSGDRRSTDGPWIRHPLRPGPDPPGPDPRGRPGRGRRAGRRLRRPRAR